MGHPNWIGQRESQIASGAGFGAAQPVTAIPARYSWERERVLQILRRWAETMQSSRSLSSATR
jgi:hypothetical protein